ncbi:hypothetical protein HYFRA_00002220 [Hymenoscyphus fraxineus]|uniref:Uncharacterized protein n=1 Tax=Hymenoscyphus fraxineus TaxID=746836 RepID=A0A9N9KLD6_9HELO|nr:hypothetical protein HYFRA_00002220 [Hymenoscyphus fraxineus]
MGWKFVEKCTNKAQLVRQWETLAKTPEITTAFLEWRKTEGGRFSKHVTHVVAIKQAIILSQHPQLAVDSVEYTQHECTMSKVINEARPYFDREEALGQGTWLFTPPFTQSTISSWGQGTINQLAELVHRLLPDVVEYFDCAHRNGYIQRNDIQRLGMDLSGSELREVPRMYLWEPEAVMEAALGTETDISLGAPLVKRQKIQATPALVTPKLYSLAGAAVEQSKTEEAKTEKDKIIAKIKRIGPQYANKDTEWLELAASAFKRVEDVPDRVG